LGEYWDDVMRLAGPPQREMLRDLVEASTETDPVDVRAALQDELLTLLPADHPLVDVLRTGTMLSTGQRAAADIAVDLHGSVPACSAGTAPLDRLRRPLSAGRRRARPSQRAWTRSTVRCRSGCSNCPH